MKARLALVVAIAGCSHRVALFCDEGTPCQDPARPFCDLTGAFPASRGIGKTCIPNPFDAGVPDATPVADAAEPCAPREWAPEFVDQEGDIGFNVDIAVDRDLGVHIVYQRDGQLARYAYRRAGSATWETQTLEAGGFYAQVVTSGDRVDVVHGTLSTLRHRYRQLDESSFAGQDVISAVAYDLSLAADENGGLHVSYFNSSEIGKSPSYQQTNGSTWALPEFVVPAGNGIATAVGIHDGVAHLVFEIPGGADRGFKYGKRNVSGEWSVESIEPGDEDPDYSALAVDTAGVHIVYNDGIEMKYARSREAGGLERSPIETVSDLVLETPGVATDAQGGIHATYRLQTEPQLRYAHRDSTTTAFLAETIEPGNVGRFSSVAVDVSGGIHVAYIDEAGKDVKYAYLCR